MKNIFKSFNTRIATLTVTGALILAGSAVAFSDKPKVDKHNSALNVPLDDRPISRESIHHSSFAPIVKKIAPGVVKVSTMAHIQNTRFSADPNQGMDDIFRQFFGDQFGGRNPRRNLPAPRQHGVGSGVITTSDGYILTNNHVVDGAEEVKVELQDGRQFTAKVIGRDPKSDVAVIKIDAKDLPAVPMADSDKVEIGDVVLAVGNPFAIGQTVTMGIVSATGRAGSVGLDYEDFIQTDAAINPGNSGGALIDSEGRLIGINTAILSPSGGNNGIGFAIPSNLARDIMQSLVTDGKVTRGFLGVMIQDVTPDLAKEFNLKSFSGALVSDVTPKSPAEKAGIRAGDVITEVNGKKVSDTRHLKLEVGRAHPGQVLSVKLLRDGVVKSMDVAVKELPNSTEVAGNHSSPAEDTGTLNGVAVADLDSQARQQFDVPSGVNGVVITQVQPDSAAAEAGLKAGDVIQEINRKRVKTAEEAISLTEKDGDKKTLLRIWRKGGSHFVVVDESKAG